MDKRLLKDAIIKYLSGVVILGMLIFIPAGSFDYMQGRLLMAVLFIPMFCAGIVMMVKAPDLLRKRLDAKEEQSEQKAVILASGIMFISSFVIAGLSFRFGRAMLPESISYAAAIVFLIGYALFAEVLRENAYLSRTVEVQENQKVIDTGLYGIVRHPMYLSTLLLFLSMPLILGSAVSFLIMLLYIPVIAKRIRGEEEFLEQGLEGYREYKERVKYKVIPYIW